MRMSPGVVVLVWSLAMAGGAAWGALKVTEKPIGVIGEQGEAQRVAISGDNNHLAVLIRRPTAAAGGAERHIVVVDGVPGKEYDWIVKDSLTFLSDNATVAYIVQQKDAEKKDRMFVVRGTQEGAGYHEIVNSELLPGPAGRLAFFARKSGDSKRILVVDGEESKEYDGIGSFSFSPDGKRYAYGVETAGQQMFVIDSAAGKAYDKVSGTSFMWSPDSQHYAYAGIIGKGADARVVPIMDGKEQPPTTSASRTYFSSDSKHWAYVAAAEGKKSQVILDGNPQPVFEVVGGDTLRFSPDSQHLAYVVSLEGDAAAKTAVVLDGTLQKPYSAVVGYSLKFSPDSKRLAYLAATVPDKKDPKATPSLFYVVDGQEQRAYPGALRDQKSGAVIPAFTFSPDSKRIAYVAVNAEAKSVVVIDGIQGSPYEQLDPRGMQFSPDSKHFAYLALRTSEGTARMYAVVDNAEGPPYAAVSNLMYSKDGSRMAFVASRVIKGTGGQADRVEQFVVVNGVEGTSYAGIFGNAMAFSPEGEHLAYEAQQGGKPRFVVDGQETPEHGGSLLGSRIVWDGPALFHSIIRRGQELFRMQVEVEAAH